MSTPRYLVQTFGCQMNAHDSIRIEEVLRSHGYAAAEGTADCDLIVLNTCSIREKAEHKLMSMLGTLRDLKNERPGLRVAVAGCVAQQEGEALLKKSDLVDIVIGPDNIRELPALLARSGKQVRTEFDLTDTQFLVSHPDTGSTATAYVTVMKGCDERCTYCVVPGTRGPERYRSADEILDEIRGMANSGVREVTLLGQTVNSWHDPDDLSTKGTSKLAPSGSQFAALLHRIADEVPALARVRYTSPHPRHLTDALIDAHATLPNLPRHLHLPVQSGSDRVLRRMARRYTHDEYVERVTELKRRTPGLTLSTDLIVGFPGETDEDFEDTLRLVRSAGFVAAYCFKYSPRPNTPALALGDDIPETVKDERLQRLFEVLAVQQRNHLQSLEGAEVEVLLESPNRASTHRYTGRSERHEIVHVELPESESTANPIGRLVKVRVRKAFEHSLLASPDGYDIPTTLVPRPREAKTKLRLLAEPSDS